MAKGREKLEAIVDALWGALEDKRSVKPRACRQKARQTFLCVEKQRKHRTKTLRKAIGRQLRFLRRDLGIIARLHDQGASLECLTGKQMHDLLVIAEVYRQRQEMYINRTHRTQARIVSIAQPHIRPIVRGKASAEVEFGAKIAVSRVNDCFRIETLDWNNFNEGTELITAIERYRARYGVYPQAVLADKLYRNRANLAFCKAQGIRLSGPRLSRPGPAAKEDRQVARSDSAARNGIESPFGIGKRRYGLSRIMAKLRETAESVIAMQFLLLNLDCRVRAHALRLLRRMQNAWDVLSRRWKLDGMGWICHC